MILIVVLALDGATSPLRQGKLKTRTYFAPGRSYRSSGPTRWETADGTAEVTDFMPPREDGEPPVLVRLVQGVSGTVDMGVRLTLRFGYGSIVPWVTKIEGGIRATAGPDSV